MEQGERTILSAMDNVLKLSYQETVVNNYKEEYYEINDALYELAADDLAFLASEFHITGKQAVLLCIIIQECKGDDISKSDLSEKLKANFVSFLNIETDIKALESLRLIQRCRHSRLRVSEGAMSELEKNRAYIAPPMGKRQEELVKWAKGTRDFYMAIIGEVGEDKAHSFYNQSKLTESLSCELMVIGFNPGEGCIFSEWNKKSFTYSQDFLLEGNPCFWNKDDATILEEYRDHWDIWRKIHKMLTYGSRGDVLEDLSRFVFTNMIFFGSNKETELGPLRQFSVECSRRTLELIPVLRPSVVLLNGCGQMFEKVADVKLQSLFPYNAMSFVVCNGTLFLSIKHTAYRYTDEEMVLIGKTLGYALDYPTDFGPERVSVMFEAEKQAYITRVHQQKESSRQNKADRHKQAEDILTAVRNKFLCAELPKGMGHNKSYHGLSLSDGKIEVYTTDTKAELIQIFWDSGIDERIAIILEDKLKGYMFTCKSSERKAYIRDIKPEIFIENVLPSLLELLN